MAKLSGTITSNISSLSKKELEKLVLKAAATDKVFHDYLLVNYFDKQYGEQDLFELVKQDLLSLFSKSYKGFSRELQMANMLAACSKRIDQFSKVCKNKNLEADLILFALDVPFSNGSGIFRTCFTALNYKTVLLLKRLIKIVQTKLHPDLRIEYVPVINEYLSMLHGSSNYLDYVHALPGSVEECGGKKETLVGG